MTRKLGVSADGIFEADTLEALDQIKAAGFDSIFTDFYDDKTTNRQIAEKADKLGLTYETIHAPFFTDNFGKCNSLWVPDENTERFSGLLLRCIDTCADLKIPTMIMHVSNGEFPPRINDFGYEAFARLIDRAGERGVNLAFENLRSLANLAFIFETFRDHGNVGFCWDVGHEECFAHGLRYMPLFGDKTIALHIHDNFRRHNEDLHLLPFDGTIDYDRVAQSIADAGYTGTLMLEVLPHASHHYDTVPKSEYIREAYARAAKLRTMVETCEKN